MSGFNLIPLRNWGFNIKKPFVIAGPCACESEEQMRETAERLKDQGVSGLRAGIWKPRTRPGMFEGIGKEGLSWLVGAGKNVGLPVSVEVATGNHVELALNAGVDILWVGARTTVNPFSVQEIADALKGVDVPVFVKNPLNPDLQLWIGGLERIHVAGIKRLGAIHRGFSSYEKTKYRNKPMWELPIELRRLHSEIPILVDPSHISGERTLVASIAQKAFDLSFDGLMIEAHRDPDKAWSDVKQQITPEKLGEIVSNLIVRNETPGHDAEDVLLTLRQQIDRIDNYLLEILGERMDIVRKIAEFKLENGITILQTNRWKEIVEDRVKKADQKELTQEFVRKMMEVIHKESIRQQSKIMDNSNL
ncbi:MAG: bifunctional 3-deoxy-7-phosphoheptulonate synthase/chorismate mutase type II [Pyrinomonadaceae bacterium]|nr:bifunctional 3-deoxy-7-phosphoheptulonate synthase/chorismate mutase type II [Pyrinomonadaceae bacterium]